ncbi:MAG: pseudouridine synthase [Agarilytica sp.]
MKTPSTNNPELDAEPSQEPEQLPGEKLQKVLARAGLGSRREMEREISDGKVEVNGKVAKLGERVDDSDAIFYCGKKISHGTGHTQPLRVLLYNKPEGEICSRVDPEGRRTVYEKLPRLKSGRWISVGRLDFNTSGLLLFTNEGELANKLMHPSSNIDREYLVRIQGDVDEDMIERLKEGVLLDDGVAKFTDVKSGSHEGSNAWFYCVVMEGKNREVRRLWESQDVRVSRLKRVRYGNIFIPSHVRVGQWVELDYREVCELCETANYPQPPKPKFSAQLKQRRERHERKLRSRAYKNASKKNKRR